MSFLLNCPQEGDLSADIYMSLRDSEFEEYDLLLKRKVSEGIPYENLPDMEKSIFFDEFPENVREKILRREREVKGKYKD